MMKKNFITLALSLLVTAGAFAGNVKESSVPTTVRAYVEKNYPRVAPVEWDYEEQGNYYTAQFKVAGMNCEVEITPDGKLLESSTEIASAQLPEGAIGYIGKQYPGFKIKQARKLYRNGTTTYEADINGQNSNRTLLFSENGTFIDKKM